ncbi:unnamed protein product [Symbiodinium necroappetens]|uniref:Uncharacterized protein n=1 Tax=Symbiodinium necroappetens TaxID=1628268 RepID=A0A812YC59_9DINO|nr:unnamed protein product [Symbiodinium necroappetens]|mmetsp:Transcript_97024/g.230861  ORF Transcript_97024/g.230861 Transcript_97024/m.230861 type:complete len:442 (+) Transcript_97024:32-1357(+)
MATCCVTEMEPAPLMTKHQSISSLSTHDLGAPSDELLRKSCDHSAFRLVAPRILDECANLGARSMPLQALRSRTMRTTPTHRSRVAASMPIQALQRSMGTTAFDPFHCYHRRDSIVCSEPPPTSPHFDEIAVTQIMSNDFEVDEDGLLHLDGEDALVRKASSRIDETGTQTSSALWKDPEQGVILVDWDDTLFATTWLAGKSEFKSWQREWVSGAPPKLSEEDARDLAELDKAARAFLCAASALGQVVCVTLSRKPWQHNTMKAFMPELAKAWEEAGVEVIYASEVMLRRHSSGGGECRHASGPGLVEQEVILMGQSIKKKETAMRRVINKIYGKGSWKNVVSIGDGEAEFNALRDISFKHTNPTSGVTGSQKRFRMKAVQMLDSPTCNELTTQLQILQAWMPALMHLDDDFFLTLSDGEEDILAMHNILLERLEGQGQTS